jgi:amino acid transporter
MPAPAKTELSRTLREHDLLLLFIGSVIGSGIFLTPGLIQRQIGGSVSWALMVWLLGGLLSLLGALTYAELAAANPEAGGLYCYIRDAFGRLPAFLYGWSLLFVIASGTIAALAHAFTTYMQEIVPLSPVEASATTILMIAVVTVINVWGTRKSSDVQNVTTIIKAGFIVVLGALLLALGLNRGSFQGAHPAGIAHPPGTYVLFSGVGLAMITVLWAYEGWQFGTYSAGEVQNPQRSFPRTFLFGSLILIGLYLFAVVAYLVALGPVQAAQSDAIAASAARAVLGPWAAKFVAAAILVSTFSSTNSVVLTAPRVFFAMANDNLFFKKLADVSPRFGTPALAVLVLGVWSCVLASAAGFAKLANGAIFIGWIFYGLGAAAIFPIRRANPGKPLPYRVPVYPFTPFVFVLAALAIIGNALFVALRDPHEFLYLLVAIALMLLGLPGYIFWSRRKT